MAASLDQWQERMERHFASLTERRATSGFPLFALEHLAMRRWSSPSGLGYACGNFSRQHPTTQAAGRVGGRVGMRLVDMGLASCLDTRLDNGWPGGGYAITPAGHKALRQAGIVPIKGPHAVGGRNA